MRKARDKKLKDIKHRQDVLARATRFHFTHETTAEAAVGDLKEAVSSDSDSHASDDSEQPAKPAATEKISLKQAQALQEVRVVHVSLLSCELISHIKLWLLLWCDAGCKGEDKASQDARKGVHG